MCILLIINFAHIQLCAQSIRMQNDIVWNSTDTLCLYSAYGNKKPTLNLLNSFTNNLIIPEEENFKDYTFTNSDGKYTIYATAKVLSSPMNAYLRYYYKIEFPDADTAVYIPYRYDCINRFLESVVKINVIEFDSINISNLYKLVQHWQKKISRINNDELYLGNSVNYNLSPYTVDDKQEGGEIDVTIKDKNIYYNGTLFGRYELSEKLRSSTLPGSGKGGYFFYIRTLDGKLFGELEVANQYADIWVWPKGAKKSMSIYTAAREEDKVIAIATKFLIVYTKSIANK